uniref:Uncharacterized protein n=1 Tax=Panagrolaimus sp. PS1159 TaxID=55785 RepID=A0AC35FLA5_9BILA
MGCLPTTSSQLPTSALIGHPGDPGYPGPPGPIVLKGKREIDVSEDILSFMTKETNFKAAEKLIENERESLLSKLSRSFAL